MTLKYRLLSLTLPLLLMLGSQIASGQDNTGDDSTVTYPASYFAEYEPVTAQDMLNRIPGVSSGGGGGGPGGFSGGRGGPPGGFSGGGASGGW